MAAANFTSSSFTPQDGSEAPDILEFFDSSTIYQSADLVLRGVPDLLPPLTVAPKENDFVLYRQFCEEQGLL